MGYIKLYKLTTKDNFTRKGEIGETKWKIGKWITAAGTGGLCTAGVIHAYRSSLFAALLNPAHAYISKPVCWLAEGEEIVEESADKIGVKRLRVIRREALPVFTIEQRVRFAIGVALEVDSDKSFRQWALAWLAGTNRFAYAASAAFAAFDASPHAAASAYAAFDARAAVTYAAYAGTHATKLTWKRLHTIAEWALTENPEPLKG